MGNPKRSLEPFNFNSAEEHPQFVSAAARGLLILRCFEYGEQFLGNQEIVLRTGLPKPTVSRLTFTLASLGYLAYSAKRGKYALGVAVLSLGHTFTQCNPVIAIARPLMRACADEIGSSVMLGAPDGMRMVLLATAEVGHCPDFPLEPGSRVPHGLTALGRADLAARRPELFERELQELKADCRPFEWPRIRDGILQARADVARQGFCYSLGTWRPELYAVGVPMVSSTEPDRILAFSCGGPAEQVSEQHLTEVIGPRLLKLRDAVRVAVKGVF